MVHPRKSADGRKPNNSTPNYSHPDTYINYCPLSRMEWATWRECFGLQKLHEAFQYNFKPLVLASWLLFIPSSVRCSALRQPLASTVETPVGPGFDDVHSPLSSVNFEPMLVVQGAVLAQCCTASVFKLDPVCPSLIISLHTLLIFEKFEPIL